METISTLQEKLHSLSLVLPPAPPPGGSYVSVNLRGPMAYLAIQFPIQGKEFLYQGTLGQDLTTERGYQAAKLAGLNVLAQIEKYVGFEKVKGLNHADIYYQSSDGWDEGPLVANGASDLFVQVLGEKGHHSRAIFGVHKLPRNFCVGITCTFTLGQEQS